MSSVDNRVVQMHFDNAQFEQGVAQTIQSLKNLDSSLLLKNTNAGLGELGKALENVNVNPISKGFQNLKGVAGGALEGIISLASTAANTVKVLGIGLAGAATAQMVHGGFTRAANIEQAKFQLEGLGVAWDKISGSIDYAVKGTAYGLDEAALAASNFVASGVALGDDMSTALRGISGVAAMTNRSYSEIAQTFTRVAANGRAFAIDLRSFASAGLNASAALARYLREVQKQSDVTEQTVQDMVSRGEIDFHTFAAAMDWAFGAHAKEANRTFNGAFANMRAALSRIGADFAAPIRELGRHTFLGVTSIVDNIRAGLNAVGRIVHGARANRAYGIGEFSGSIVSTFAEDMGHLGEAVETALTKFGESDVLKNFVASFLMPIDAIWHGNWVNGMAIIETVMTSLSQIKAPDILTEGLFKLGEAMYVFGDWTAKQMPLVILSIRKLFEILSNIARAIGTFISPILDAFFETFFDGTMSLGDAIESGLRSVYDFLFRLDKMTENLGLTADAMAQVKAVAGTVFSFLGTIGKTVVGGIAKVFGGLLRILSSLIPPLSTVTQFFVDLIVWITPHIVDLITDVVRFFTDLSTGIYDTVSSFIDFNAIVSNVDGFLSTLKTTISQFSFSGALNSIKGFIGSFVDFEKLGSSAANSWSAFVEVLKEIGKFIGSGFSDIFKTITELFSGSIDIGAMFADFLKSVGGGEDNKVSQWFDTTTNSIDGFGKKVDEVSSPVTDFFKKIEKFVSGLTLDDLVRPLSMLFSGVIAGSVAKFMYDLSKMPSLITGTWTSINDLLKNIAAVPKAVSGFLGSLGKAAVLTAQAEAIKAVAIALLALAGSLFVISLIDSDKLLQSVGALSAMFVLMGVFIGVLTWTVKKLAAFADNLQGKGSMFAIAAQIAAMGTAMLSLAASVAILSASVYLLSRLQVDELIRGGLAVVGLIVALGVFVFAIGKFVGNANFAGIAATLLTLTVALTLLAGLVAALGALIGLNPMMYAAGLAGLLGILALLAAFFGTIAVMADSSDPKAILTLTASLLAITVTIGAVTGVIFALGSMDANTLGQGALGLISIVAGLFAMMYILTELSTRTDPKKLLASAASMVIFATAVKIMAVAIAALATAASLGGNLAAAVGSIAITMTVMAAALLAIGDLGIKAVAGAGALGIMAIGLMVMATALSMLSLIPWDKLLIGAGVLSLFLAIVTGVGLVATVAVEGLMGLGFVLLALGTSLLMISASVGLFALGLTLLGATAPATATAIGQAMDIMAQHVEESGPKLAKGIGDSIGAFAEAIANKKEAVAVASATLVSGFLMGLASMLGEIVAFGMRVTIAIARGIADNIAPLGQAALDIISGLIMGLAAGVGNLISAAFWLMTMFITGLAEAVNVQGPLLYNAVSALMSSIFALIEDMLADLVEGIPIKGHEWAEAIRGRAAELRQASAEATAGIHEQFDEAFQDSQASAESGMSTVSTTISSATGSIAGAAGQVGAAAGVSLQASMGNMAAGVDMDSVMEAIASGADPAAISAMMVGTTADQGLQEGMSTMPDNAAASTQAAVDAAASVDAYGPASGLGSDFGSGFMGGIDSMIAPVASKAADMVRAAKEAAQSEQNSSSPSKDAMKYGKWFGQGYEIGLAGMIGRVADTAAELVGGAKGTVVDSMRNTAKLLDGIDWDANPVITPVLDTSLLQQGMSELPGFFNNQFMAQAAWAQFAATGMANPWRSAEPISSTTVGDTYTIYIDGQMLNDSEELRSSVLTFMGGLRRIGGMNLG